MQQLNPQLLDAVLNIAHRAGEHLKAFYAKSVEIKIKADHTPVTEADLFISQFVIEQLQQLTPNVPIISEENCNIPLEERAKWKEYWLIDPLDGTQQFINRTDQFSVVVALIQQHRPVLGVIHAPILHKTYYAMANYGAYLNEQNQLTRLQLSKKLAQSNRLRITIGTSNSEQIRKMVKPEYQIDFIQYGSSSLKAGLVAEGKADCYIRLGDTGEWDTAAAEVLLTELGGKIVDLQFIPLSYNQRQHFINPHFIVLRESKYDWQTVFMFN